MIKKIISQCKEKLFLISYSGGLDSTVLLDTVAKIKGEIPQIQLRAIHINHNLHDFSQEWSKHCTKICQKYRIPLIIENININQKNGNLEERLRIKRYQIIWNHLLLNEVLLTGHHINDQCETFILSLKRGSGPTGLSGMSSQSFLGNKKIIRPFLNKTKKELEHWAKSKKLQWIEDFSNSNIEHDRNFIRHKIIPSLEKRWPFFLKNCIRSSNICREETDILNHLLHEKITDLIQFDDSLNIKNFIRIKKKIGIALIRYWILLQKIKTPSYKSIQCIYHQMVYSRIDAKPKIILKKHEIRRYKKSIFLIKKQTNLINTILFWHKKKETIVLPNNLGNLQQNNQGITLPAPKKNELINIRFQYEGYVLILGRDKKRKIKKIWQEKNIPPWIRNQIPLLFYNNTFISALGIFVINIKNRNNEVWKISWSNNLNLNHKNKFLFN